MGPRIVILGRGNVATALEEGFRTTDAEVLQLWHRGEELRQDADLYIIAVKDDAVEEVAALCPQDAYVAHTAGSIPMDVISQRHRGVIYPMQSFTKGRKTEWDRVPFFVEAASEEDYEFFDAVVKRLSANVRHLSTERRHTLHLAAVWVSNFTNHMWTVASDILEKEDIPFSVMLPLIEETADKVHAMSPRKAQTGPARRGDTGVMSAHEAMLPEKLRNLYRIISQSIHDDQLRPETN